MHPQKTFSFKLVPWTSHPSSAKTKLSNTWSLNDTRAFSSLLQSKTTSARPSQVMTKRTSLRPLLSLNNTVATSKYPNQTRNTTEEISAFHVGAAAGGISVLMLLIVAVIGLFVCRNSSPCKTLTSKMKVAYKRMKTKKEKKADIMDVLRYSPFIRNPNLYKVTRQESVSSSVPVRLMKRDTYDGLTAVDKVRDWRYPTAPTCASSETETDIKTISDTDDDNTSLSIVSAYSLCSKGLSIGIDKQIRYKGFKNQPYQPNFCPLYNQSLSYSGNKKLWTVRQSTANSAQEFKQSHTRQIPRMTPKMRKILERNDSYPYTPVSSNKQSVPSTLKSQSSFSSLTETSSNNYKSIHSY